MSSLRDRIFHILKMTEDDPLLAADRVIAAMFEHLENDFAPRLIDAERDLLRMMLVAARKEAEK